jgi:hypothetical protein
MALEFNSAQASFGFISNQLRMNWVARLFFIIYFSTEDSRAPLMCRGGRVRFSSV